MANVEHRGWDYEGRVVEAMADLDRTIARFCKALGEPIPEDAIRRAEQLRGAVDERDAARRAFRRLYREHYGTWPTNAQLETYAQLAASGGR